MSLQMTNRKLPSFLLCFSRMPKGVSCGCSPQRAKDKAASSVSHFCHEDELLE